MKLMCFNCDEEVDVIIEMKGPHLKASCSQCKKYIKFLNKEEKHWFEGEEDTIFEKRNGFI